MAKQPDAHTMDTACERSRLAAIRQVLAHMGRRSPVPRLRALWPFPRLREVAAKPRFGIRTPTRSAPPCERGLAAIRQVPPFPPT